MIRGLILKVEESFNRNIYRKIIVIEGGTQPWLEILEDAC